MEFLIHLSTSSPSFGQALFWLILLVVIREAIMAAIFLFALLVGTILGNAFQRSWLLGVSVFLGIVGALIWEIYAIVWIVKDIIALIAIGAAA